MANKSYASSEIGGDESHYGDPEFSKDFNSAYQKVNHFPFKVYDIASWEDLLRTRKHSARFLRRNI